MEVVDLTHRRAGAGKRPASLACGPSGDREQKRMKDVAREGCNAVPTVTAALPSRSKRPFQDCDGAVVEAMILAGAGATTAAVADTKGHRHDNGAAPGRADGSRVLQSLELENSIAIISGALSWRNPVKPHKLPRLHGRLPTAVHGIVDVGAEEDDDDSSCNEEQGLRRQQQQQPQKATTVSGGTHLPQQLQQQPGAARSGGVECQGCGQLHPPGSQPACMHPPPQQLQEWGRLFRALSLGGPWQGSQRSDPVWAAATSNRAAGGGTGSGRRSGGSGPSCNAGVPGADLMGRPVLQTGSSDVRCDGGGGGGSSNGSCQAGPSAPIVRSCTGQAPFPNRPCDIPAAVAPRDASAEATVPVPDAMDAESAFHAGAPAGAMSLNVVPPCSTHAIYSGAAPGARHASALAPDAATVSPITAVCPEGPRAAAHREGPVGGAVPQVGASAGSGSGSAQGGFLAKEAWRLLSSSGAGRV